MLNPNPDEIQRRDEILEELRLRLASGSKISLPSVTRQQGASADFALLGLAQSESHLRGHVGPYYYLFEGEEDLLHLMVVHAEGIDVQPEEGQAVAAFALPGVEPSLIWFKPGQYSHHFYIGHDLVL